MENQPPQGPPAVPPSAHAADTAEAHRFGTGEHHRTREHDRTSDHGHAREHHIQWSVQLAGRTAGPGSGQTAGRTGVGAAGRDRTCGRRPAGSRADGRRRRGFTHDGDHTPTAAGIRARDRAAHPVRAGELDPALTASPPRQRLDRLQAARRVTRGEAEESPLTELQRAVRRQQRAARNPREDLVWQPKFAYTSALIILLALAVVSLPLWLVLYRITGTPPVTARVHRCRTSSRSA